MIDVIYQTFRIDDGHSGESKGETEILCFFLCKNEDLIRLDCRGKRAQKAFRERCLLCAELHSPAGWNIFPIPEAQAWSAVRSLALVPAFYKQP